MAHNVNQKKHGAAKIILVMITVSPGMSGYGAISLLMTPYTRCIYGDTEMYRAHMVA